MQSFVDLPRVPSTERRCIIVVFALKDEPRLQKLDLVECFLLRLNPAHLRSARWGLTAVVPLQYRLTSDIIYMLALLKKHRAFLIGDHLLWRLYEPRAYKGSVFFMGDGVSCFLVYVDQQASFGSLQYVGCFHILVKVGREVDQARVWRLFLNLHRAILGILLFGSFLRVYLITCLKID